MLRKNALLAMTLFVTHYCNGYTIDDLKVLQKDVKGAFESLKQTLTYTSGKFPTWMQWTIRQTGIKQEEIDCIPRFKSLANSDSQELIEWFSKQTNDSVELLLTKVDEHKTLEELINWQNKSYPENLSKEEGFKRLVESAHWKKKYLYS